MKYLKVVFAFAVLAAPLPVLSTPANAASAHNSQIGAYGPTSNNSAHTHRHLHKKVTR